MLQLAFQNNGNSAHIQTAQKKGNGAGLSQLTDFRKTAILDCIISAIHKADGKMPGETFVE